MAVDSSSSIIAIAGGISSASTVISDVWMSADGGWVWALLGTPTLRPSMTVAFAGNALLLLLGGSTTWTTPAAPLSSQIINYSLPLLPLQNNNLFTILAASLLRRQSVVRVSHVLPTLLHTMIMELLHSIHKDKS